MKLRAFAFSVLTVLAVALTLAIASRSPAQAPQATVPAPTVGRYQMAAWLGPKVPSNLYLIDTATGECWQKEPTSPTWTPFAPPIK